MKNSGKWVVVGATGLMILGGCGQNSSSSNEDNKVKNTSETTTQSLQKETEQKNSPKHSSTKESSTKETTHNQAASHENPQQAALWDAQKSAELQTFMNDWGNRMGQHYTAYGQNNDVNFYGLNVPSGLLAGKMTPNVANQPVQMSWSADGESGNGYKIVAVYSDIDSTTTPPMTAHCYLFTIYNGQPKVLITEQNQGNPENAIYFKETSNQELKDKFNQIVSSGGTDKETNSAKQSNQQSTTTYLINNQEEAKTYLVNKMPQAGNIQFQSMGSDGNYYFTGEGGVSPEGVAKWEYVLDRNGNILRSSQIGYVKPNQPQSTVITSVEQAQRQGEQVYSGMTFGGDDFKFSFANEGSDKYGKYWEFNLSTTDNAGNAVTQPCRVYDTGTVRDMYGSSWN